MAINPQTYTISDFIDWNTRKQLYLSPDFQRGNVWSIAAKSYLIDSILNDYPVPQIYFRTKIDPVTQITIREVVDGQQRLRAIFDFAANNLRLNSKSKNFFGTTYMELDQEFKERFLSYSISTIQLINADNRTVLEVFSRLNSYSVKLNAAELRHAQFNEPVKIAIVEAAQAWAELWNDYSVISLRDQVRLKHHSLMAELFMTIDKGLGDGGESKITQYYTKNSSKSDDYFDAARDKIDQTIIEILSNLGPEFKESTFYDPPNFLILFACVSLLKNLSPPSYNNPAINAYHGKGINWRKAINNLTQLSSAFDVLDEVNPSDGQFQKFISLSKSTTHRISTRLPRLEILAGLICDDAN